jgi:oxygen-independent coproporphyrinogen-3 oxidase
MAECGSKPQFDAAWLEGLKRHLPPEQKGAELKSLYLGGGTPSLIEEPVFQELFGTLRNFFKWHPEIEISLEVNPEDISEQKLEFFRGQGVNRLSVGVQSFSAQELRRLERMATLEALEQRLGLLGKFFDNYSFDLMFGIPDQNRESLEQSLSRIFSFSPPHVSIYLLTIAEDHKWRRSERIKPLLVSEEVCATMYEWICDRMKEQGYHHYEVSNFAKPGFESRHNQIYWDPQKSYLALGPGAHGYSSGDQKIRYENYSSIRDWAESPNGIKDIEILDAEQQNLESAYLKLRTRKALEESRLNPEALKNFIAEGLVEKSAQGVQVTEKSWILLDGIASKLLL